METESFTSEFRKTLSSGIGALLGGKDKYYIIEHLIGSEYHYTGEKQEILLDEIILGRDRDCHVRFDESFKTVSRHHAAIVKDGDTWRLVQLSKKNSTFLNGKLIPDSWYLQHGDEIQLAVNGPKLIFRLPEKSTSFRFTERINAFKQQVIKPFQTAFIVACCVIVLIVAGCIAGGVIMHKQSQNIQKLTEINDDLRNQVNALYEELLSTNEMLEITAIRADSAQREAIKAQSENFKNKAALIKSQQNLEIVQEQMQQLQEEMNSFYKGIMSTDN